MIAPSNLLDLEVFPIPTKNVQIKTEYAKIPMQSGEELIQTNLCIKQMTGNISSYVEQQK